MLTYVLTRLNDDGAETSNDASPAILKDTGLFSPRMAAESLALSGERPARVRIDLYNHGATIGLHKPITTQTIDPPAA